ncbi:PREDICTED: endocuticle structural glycoprotein SgAbd-8-like [Ceratosolen solmsi marchali]|uniref:Endocuticle structural glycoprotein SgAbd-8-like n=1 Tax=Ceratosolen solmsi marchali TaxID=326594 RepID=A0AAJ6YLJ1_9HYME|nr:PREDICTED: endocuticle structural glycoprotein SgAbd-8-like [Ceratosolen solmsi marchali]
MKIFVTVLALVALVRAQQQTLQQPIAIVRQAQDISPEGSYSYSYETENGIAAAELGEPRVINEEGAAAIAAQGQFQYTAPDGTPIAVSYVADENGFQPQGAHLPVPQPIPEAIQRALDYIATHPQPQEQSSQ